MPNTAEICVAYTSGKSSYDLAIQFRCCATTIRQILRRKDIPRRSRKQAAGGLTPEQELEVSQAYAAGKSSRTLAAEHGVSPTYVLQILRRHGVRARSLSAAARNRHTGSMNTGSMNTGVEP